MLNRPSATHFSEISIKIQILSFKKMLLKVLFAQAVCSSPPSWFRLHSINYNFPMVDQHQSTPNHCMCKIDQWWCKIDHWPLTPTLNPSGHSHLYIWTPFKKEIKFSSQLGCILWGFCWSEKDGRPPSHQLVSCHQREAHLTDTYIQTGDLSLCTCLIGCVQITKIWPHCFCAYRGIT